MCVRYAPGQAGQHAAQVTIQTPYATYAVSLRGHSTRHVGLLPTVSVPPGTGSPTRSPRVNRTKRYRLAGLLIAVLMGGLAWVGYRYVRQAPPVLAQNPTAEPAVPPAPAQPRLRPEVRSGAKINLPVLKASVPETVRVPKTNMPKASVANAPVVVKSPVRSLPEIRPKRLGTGSRRWVTRRSGRVAGKTQGTPAPANSSKLVESASPVRRTPEGRIRSAGTTWQPRRRTLP